MDDNGQPVASTVLGTIGVVCWCVQLTPQIFINWRRKDCSGLPLGMFILWSCSGLPFGTYMICQDSNLPLQVQPHTFMGLSMITLSQILWYPPVKLRPWWKPVGLMALLIVVLAGAEAGCIIPFRMLYDKGITWPVTLFGVIASICLVFGWVVPYPEIIKRRGQVIGINLLFIAIDSTGTLTSLISLLMQNGPFDLLGCILYSLVLTLELGIFFSQIIWLLRTHKSRKLQREQEEAERDVERGLGISDSAHDKDDADKPQGETRICIREDEADVGSQHSSTRVLSSSNSVRSTRSY